jgi:hypothetical protein
MRLVFAEFDRAMIVEPRQCRLHSYKTSFKFSSHVRFGSWLCENAKALNRNRRSYSSKTVSGIQFENTFDLEIELKNVILVAFRFFAFLHSQGQTRTSGCGCMKSVHPPRADIATAAR